MDVMRVARRSRAEPEPEPEPCGGCGTAFRAAYTDGRCPICDWEAPAAQRPASRLGSTRAGRLARSHWALAALIASVIGNVVILVIVAASVSK